MNSVVPVQMRSHMKDVFGNEALFYIVSEVKGKVLSLVAHLDSCLGVPNQSMSCSKETVLTADKRL